MGPRRSETIAPSILLGSSCTLDLCPRQSRQDRSRLIVRVSREDAYDGAVPVDVVTSVEIERPRADVAAFAADPDNATRWYENIKSVEWKTAPPMSLGSQVVFAAQFLGRRLTYTYEILELVPGSRLVMGTKEGPFPWRRRTPGKTRRRVEPE